MENGVIGNTQHFDCCIISSKLVSPAKKEGVNMTEEEIKQFKEENCSKCTKNIDCKIVKDLKGNLVCTEEV